MILEGRSRQTRSMFDVDSAGFDRHCDANITRTRSQCVVRITANYRPTPVQPTPVPSTNSKWIRKHDGHGSNGDFYVSNREPLHAAVANQSRSGRAIRTNCVWLSSV